MGKEVSRSTQTSQKTAPKPEQYRGWKIYDADIEVSNDCMPPARVILGDSLMVRMAPFLNTTSGSKWSGERLGTL